MLRNLFCIFIAGVWTVVLFPFALGALIITFSSSASMYVVRRWWAPVLLWAGGAKVEVLGAEKLKAGQPYIFLSNHQSTIDIPTLFVAIPIDFRFVAKKALKYVPFLGWYMSMARFVFIDRANHRHALRSLDEAGARIRGGISIVMFPEGTRSDDRRVLPFKKGPFALALNAQVPLVPIAIEGSGVLMPKNSWRITPGPIKVSIGDPIDPAPFGDDRLALIKAVRGKVIEQSQALGGRGGNDDAAAALKEGTS